MPKSFEGKRCESGTIIYACNYLNMSICVGILVFMKPCGIVIGVRELFGSESKSQVYGHLHSLFASGKLQHIGKKK